MERMDMSNQIPLATMEEEWGYEARYRYNDVLDASEYHCHDHYEFYLHLRGGEYLGLDNSLFLLERNQMFVLPPFAMHGVSCRNALKQYERAYLSLSPEMLKILGHGQIDLDQFFRSYTSQGIYTFRLSDQDAAQCVTWLRQLEEEPFSGEPLEKFGHVVVLMNFLNVVCRGIRQSKAFAGNTVSNNIIQNVLTYINNHYTQQLKMEQIAKQFGISVSYLSHEFSKFTNRSVYDYILYRRVMLACQMMETDASLNVIAYQCGFNDYSNFLRIFTKMVGMSPRTYRKQDKRFQGRRQGSGRRS